MRGPFAGRDDAGDQVERDQPLGAGAVLVLGAVHREGDADAAEDHLRFFAAGAHGVLRLARQPLRIVLVVVAHTLHLDLALPTLRLALKLELAVARRASCGVHLVEFVHEANLQATG